MQLPIRIHAYIIAGPKGSARCLFAFWERQQMLSAVMNTYNRLDISFTHGQGIYLFDEAGKPYLDAIAGIAVNSLGHAHPAVVAAIAAQAGKVMHTSNMYRIALQEELASALSDVTGTDACFFGNSGAEANEAAIKLARLYGHQRKIKKPAIVVMEGAFHGRTMATLTATGNRKIQAGFEPLVSGFVRAPYNSAAALETIAENNSDVVAVLLEPIQGEGGVIVPDAGYLRAVRAICDAHGWLLMLDEVQSGNCRSGHWFACQSEQVLPDVLTTAKALGNGFPIGVCMTSGPASTIFAPGNHGSTYGGNPLACAAALAVIGVMREQGLAERAASLGERMLAGFRARLGNHSEVTAMRGRGLMLGIELQRACPELTQKALQNGLLINVTAGNTVRLLPPLIMTDSEADELTERVASLILDFLADSPAAAKA